MTFRTTASILAMAAFVLLHANCVLCQATLPEEYLKKPTPQQPAAAQGVKHRIAREPSSDESGGRFTVSADNILHDARTGLQWTAGQDVDTSWGSACAWATGLNLDGGGWSLPTREQLRTLAALGMASAKMPQPRTPLFGWASQGKIAWTRESHQDATVYAINLASPDEALARQENASKDFRALAVRAAGSQPPSPTGPAATSAQAQCTPDKGLETAVSIGQIRFSASGRATADTRNRFYKDQFRTGETRFIIAEAQVIPAQGARFGLPLVLTFVCAQEDGSYKATATVNNPLPPSAVYMSQAFGSDQPGRWQQGIYRVTVFNGNKELASASFTVR
ncbi:hypothetical protein NNJEOMEG_03630 [Fundidesulfovibrio magnetotacticus]|uniref:DUF1566 domain-containing protein n=1 Tax=Fundidesulfovibrio magnetotacticus TaxID=2730080 RepID=A0A6V8LTG6_9BACT|nr:DUF1566 domain-containing protein [Fundidesulfovibrio magnetotacticus]GFK95762.1 hypothetical protein NNJEOMEG_03630 [Fundidesulfovibrio magnetotacticus]